MSTIAIGVIMFILMLVLLLIGVPVIISLFGTAMLGILWMSGPTMLITQFTSGPFSQSASYNYAIMPLFTFLGILACDTGIAQDAFGSMKTCLSKWKGSLLYATIAGSAIFGACSGNGSAGSIVFAKIAMPEMNRYKYKEETALGCVTASGALSCLIPPSIPICQFAILSGYSVGTALMYGLSTGILTVVIMFVVIAVTLKLRPNTAPDVTEEDRKITIGEKVRSLKLLIPILLLFALIIGGSFFGWFHPTVGGAVGAMAIAIFALCKRIPLKRIFSAAWESASIFAGVYLIIVSGTMFGRMISMSGLTTALITAVSDSGFPGFLVVLLVIAIYMVAGCVMDILAVMIITVPIIFPILVDNLGYNPFTLIMVIVLVTGIGSITPPIGNCVFMISNVLGVSTNKIFKGVLPFVVSELAVSLIIVFIPQTVSWLPNLLALLGD